MTVQIQSLNSTVRTTTGTKDFTISGFGTPKAAIVIISDATDLVGTNQQTGRMSIGFTDGTTEYGICRRSLWGAGNSRVAQIQFDGLIAMGLHSSNATVQGKVAFDSWITDGIRLDFTEVFVTTSGRVHIILIGGSSVEAEVGVGAAASNGGTPLANPTDIDVGFKPNLVFSLSTGQISPTSQTPQSEDEPTFGIAVDDGSESQRSMNFRSLENQTYSRVSEVVSENLAQPQTNLAAETSTELTAFNTDGFSIASGFSSGQGPEIGYLALKIGSRSLTLDLLTTPTSTGVESYDVGAEPEFVFTMHTQTNVGWDEYVKGALGGLFGLSFFSEDSSFATIFTEEHLSNYADGRCASLSPGVLLGYLHTSAANYKATLDSLTSDGFDLNFSAATTAAQFVALTIPVDSGISGTGAGTLPMTTAAGVASVEFEGEGAGTLPFPTAEAAGTETIPGVGAGTLPFPTAAGAGTETIPGAAEGTLPLVTAAGEGSSIQFIFGEAAGVLPLAAGSGEGIETIPGAGEGSLPLVTAEAAGLLTYTAVGAGTLPLMAGAGVGVAPIYAAGSSSAATASYINRSSANGSV